MKRFIYVLPVLLTATAARLTGADIQFDAAPFALPLTGGQGLMWEDPREIHKVVVTFGAAAPAADQLKLQYWGSRWPDQKLPKDKQPGGGSVGWMELGNWHNGGWRDADVDVRIEGRKTAFTFKPLNQKEFPKQKDYPAEFRYTLKIRVNGGASELPPVKSIEAYTDSKLETRTVRLAFRDRAGSAPKVEAFNGRVTGVKKAARGVYAVSVEAVVNSDPNTFDRTLVSVNRGNGKFTFAVDDLAEGALFVPVFGAAVTPESDSRDYAAIASAQESLRGRSLYDLVAGREEQTWKSAWEGVPRKRSRIYLPLALDGGRHKFRLDANGGIFFRSNDHYLKGRPGKDTARLELEAGPVKFDFALPPNPTDRFLEEESLPVCHAVWETNGLRVTQVSFVTVLGGTRGELAAPDSDETGVFMTRFEVTNTSANTVRFDLPLRYSSGDKSVSLAGSDGGLLKAGANVRAQVESEQAPEGMNWGGELRPGGVKVVTLKVPYVVLTSPEEAQALRKLDFDRERLAVASYWRKRLNESARLITPEPVLDQFYRSHSTHLMVNCEKEPGQPFRFARVGSFSYGAYGNESCMMVVDLERRGFHEEAKQCLNGWLHYQGTAKLPGDFSSYKGVLYGAGGYESGGYNQHHGWILWSLAEHYRFTRDRDWLVTAAPGIIRASDWILSETARTANRHPLERGLLPAGSLEDIGDWWTWLSTSCYTWRGLDSAAWALEQLQHPEAKRIRRGADTYRENLLKNFRAASEQSPVVRLRDGTAVPHFPSHVHRRGRSFGWICETLEGAIHLLITGLIDPKSPEAKWIIQDYEDNLYLSNQYGYTLADFEKHWFGRGGMSMQACLLLDVEPYLYRDDVKHALRATFNALAVSHFPDVHMNTEHALPNMEDWTGDHFKSSDESNVCGWLRYLFLRESGEELLVGQAIPRSWLASGKRCGMDQAATYFGPVSVVYSGGDREVTARLEGPRRNPPKLIKLRIRGPEGQQPARVMVNGKVWTKTSGDWVMLPGDIGLAEVVASY